ncbi:MAG: DUF4091 domain-containing protein [Phycisphaerae bacterium]|nr:DUF4091 domain-containing protein [Phycisphaerae bacterium]
MNDRTKRIPPLARRRPARLRLIVLGLSVTLSVFLSACITHRNRSILPQPSVVGPSMRVEADQPPRADTLTFVQAENVIRLQGAVNGIVAFQLVIPATTGQAVGVELAAEDLLGPASTIHRDAVRMYRQWPITIERYPNWYLRSQGLRRSRDVPDVLVPIDAPRHGQPFVIPAGGQLAIWVEIKIPPDARPGIHQGAVNVRDADGNATRMPVEVVVRDIYLSRTDAIPIVTRVQLARIITAHTRLDPLNLKLALLDDQARYTFLRTFAILHEHGLCPYTDEVHPLATLGQDGAVQLDWTDYDAFCGPLIDGSAYREGRPAHAWPLPVDLRQPDPAQYGGIESTVYAAVLKDYLAQTGKHFEENGWLNRAFVYFDLPKRCDPQAEDLARVRQLARITHLVDERLAFASALIPQPMTAFGWFDHHFEDLSADIDIWSTPARYQHPPTLRHLQVLGKRTWLLPDRPPFSGSVAVEAPPIQARSLPWQAFLQNHNAVFLPHATDWPERLLDEPIKTRSQRSDTWLLYPGTPFGLTEPVPSVRLKQLQLGIQDYQLLRLLDAHGGGATARLLASSLIKAAGTDAYGDNYQDGLFGRRIDDPAIWELATSILIEEVAGSLVEGQDSAPDLAAVQASWAKFLSATRRLDAWTESARLAVDDRPGHTGYRVKYDVAIRNELRTPVKGKLTFDPLSPGMQRVSDVVRVGPVPEMGLVRRQLVVATPTMPPCDLDGHHTQTIVFDAGVSGRVATEATLSIVQVPRAPSPIAVDGNLADWPPSESNIVGDFRLINAYEDRQQARPAAERRYEERARAESQTVAYLCQDRDVLYIGIHAAVPDERAADAASTPRGDDPEGAAAQRSRPWIHGQHTRPTEASARALRNFVEYEDLMPLDEDLVEILIDPTNAATQSDDLYHIVLKSTGNPVFERGVGTIPPIGQRRPWPGDPPTCCVTSTEYGWCAEIAIPISTFGPVGAENPIWGFNLARLEPVRGEYSDWARAPRYCYDPRTLGNLVWPE